MTPANEITVSVAVTDMPEFREAMAEAEALVKGLRTELLKLRHELDRARADASCVVCGGRGWHTAGGNDPAACGACSAGEEFAR